MTTEEQVKAKLIIDALNNTQVKFLENNEYSKSYTISTFEGEDREKLKLELMKLLVG